MTVEKPVSWRRKSYSRTIVSALTFDGSLDEDTIELIEDLLEVWWDRYPRNRLKRRYYEGENVLKDLGISIPPPLQDVETVVGWPKKAVTELAGRVKFDGFTAEDEDVQSVLDDVVKQSRLKRKHRQAVESELVAGCDAVTVSKGKVEDGEPPVIITTHSAEDCAFTWNERLGRVEAGLVIMDYDDDDGTPDEIALYTDRETIHVDARDVLTVERFSHDMGRPMLEVLAFNATEAKPFGQSRINRAVRSITDSGVREALRTEISAEFFTSPQKYLLGVDDDPWQQKTRWEAYIGNIFTVTKTEDGSTPSFGQLSQGSMQPHTDYMRSLAARFSGETNVPVAHLGVIHDNPSSAEAMYASSEPLIIEANTLIEDNGDSLVEIALMAYATVRNVHLDSLTDEQKNVSANFRNPTMPSIVSQTDAAVKIASVVDGFAGTDVFFELLGFSEDMRRRVQNELEANRNRQAILAMMQQRRQTPQGQEGEEGGEEAEEGQEQPPEAPTEPEEA